MVKSLYVLVLLLGDSQTAGQMGRHLEQSYDVPGIEVIREAAPGKGVDYFLRALPEHDIPETVHHRQISRIKSVASKADYIIFGSLGGNDAYSGCCSGENRKKLLLKYKKLFSKLCNTGAVVVFNGSPRARSQRLSSFDKRRAEVDAIQEEASQGTCVIRNSTRSMDIPADRDGFHYNRSGALYSRYLLQLPGMQLPFQETKNNTPF